MAKVTPSYGIGEALVRVTFIHGLGLEAQKHCILDQAETLEQYLKAAQDFEKVERLNNHTDSMTISSPNVGTSQ